MSDASSETRALLARTPIVVRPGPYTLASWPLGQSSAVGAAVGAAGQRSPNDVALWLRDDREVTALLRASALPAAPQPQHVQTGWALLTLDQPMGWEVTGVLAAVSGALAAAGIPIAAVTAFARDHVLVPGARLDEALAALKGVCGEVRRVD